MVVTCGKGVSPSLPQWVSTLTLGSGDDDYFSSDLSNERLNETFGKINKPVMFLHCSDDELVPKFVDRGALFERWVRATPEGQVSKFSGFVPANHAVKTQDMWRPISEKVGKFLVALDS